MLATNDHPRPERMRAVFTGGVQGVGFRQTVYGLATRLGLTGYVRNEPDGSVILEAEGPPDSLDALLKAIHTAPAGRWLKGVDQVRGQARADFDGFEIRFF